MTFKNMLASKGKKKWYALIGVVAVLAMIMLGLYHAYATHSSFSIIFVLMLIYAIYIYRSHKNRMSASKNWSVEVKKIELSKTSSNRFTILVSFISLLISISTFTITPKLEKIDNTQSTLNSYRNNAYNAEMQLIMSKDESYEAKKAEIEQTFQKLYKNPGIDELEQKISNAKEYLTNETLFVPALTALDFLLLSILNGVLNNIFANELRKQISDITL
ncbi:hypothetical protein [Fructobacillus tropaeoli]|uniref:Uncharacterized protein n=1 Tax=Fructobacillus tropaeoli TaxID=709323 RepID=A0ABN9Z517_9LACO|nr:unnamed protein product [Fructobacillus tropaeoli]